MQHPGPPSGSSKATTTIDHAGALAVSRRDALSDERVASRAAQVAPADAARPSAPRVIIDPETSDILQTSEVMPPPPTSPPKLPAGVRQPPWPPPVWLAERTQVFLSTGSVAALGGRP